MARYRGPKVKKLRSLGDMPGLTRKVKGEKKNPPGQHGASAKRQDGNFLVRLRAKQVLRFNYGVSEKQLKRYYKMAKDSKKDTAQQMLVFLESRLDNVVFRAGFAPTIPAARQLVSHGHVLVNDARCNIPSLLLRPGDKLELRESAREIPFVLECMEEPSIAHPSYLVVTPKEFAAEFKMEPNEDDVPLDVNKGYIVEYYAKVA